MVGKTLQEIGLRAELGVSAVGVWQRGEFTTARPRIRVGSGTVLVLAGSEEQLRRFNERYRITQPSGAATVIIGGGRVGRATARALAERGIDYRIVEQNAERTLRIADRAYVLNTGRIDRSGSAKDMLEQVDIRGAYLGA